MSTHHSIRRGLRVRASLAIVAGAALAAGVTATATAAPSGGSQSQSPFDIVTKAHPGASVTLETKNAQIQWEAAHKHPAASSATAATSANTLAFSGGTNGIGVMSGAKTNVYLVFLGSQWGTQSTDANGDAKFTGDPDNAAPAVQEFFKGIGTGNELWSAGLTQWCDGAGVASGATSCPTGLPASQYIPYQTGGVLAGTWYDNSAYPATPNGHALAQEAVNAAAHFGNTTAAANRNSYYVILSPHGTNPDNYQAAYPNGYCAYHMWNAYPEMTGGPVDSPYGNIAFSNQPYNMDMGASCGVGFVNGTTNGTLDGYTMTIGHEWQEMMSDVDPNSGWANPGTNGGQTGSENADECAWIHAGQAGGAANVTFGTHGTFAMQSIWSNDDSACDISHPIVNHGGGGQGNTVTVTQPANQSTTVGTAASLQIKASDSASGQTLAYSATGLPAGLSINASTGLISGTPTTAGTSNVTVSAKDSTGASGSASFTWTVAPSGTGGGGTVTVTNPNAQYWLKGYAYSGLQIKATDSKGLTLTFTATGLPPGMTISTSGLITGTPTVSGTYTVKVTATDSGGSTGTTTFTFYVF